MTTDEKLKKIEALGKQIPRLGELVRASQGEVTEYDVASGTALGLNLLHQAEIAVCRLFFSAGTRFREHSHSEKEWLILYSGKCVCRYANMPARTLDVGDFVYFAPEEIHEFEFLTDTWMVGVSVPAIKGFPDGQQRERPA